MGELNLDRVGDFLGLEVFDVQADGPGELTFPEQFGVFRSGGHAFTERAGVRLEFSRPGEVLEKRRADAGAGQPVLNLS